MKQRAPNSTNLSSSGKSALTI